MFIWPLIEGCIIALVALFIISQIIWPAFANTPLFPLFRKTPREHERVEEELHDVEEQLEIQEKKNQVDQLIELKNRKRRVL